MSQVAASLGYTSLAGPGAAPRILVVDDEPYMCDVCTRTLQRGGYHVQLAALRVCGGFLSDKLQLFQGLRLFLRVREPLGDTPVGPLYSAEYPTGAEVQRISRGRPSVRSAMTLRWISLVPAQIELAW